MACGNVFLNKYFYLYGLGISNQKVIDYFIKNKVKYTIITEQNFNCIKKEDVLIKSPGIPDNDKIILFLKQQQTLIISDIELFYILRPNLKYIGITGTCGKTTTCTVLNQIINKSYKVAVCGNIGIPIFEFIESDLDYLIVELSSYQLEYIHEFKPLFYIILNIFPHHLNNHNGFSNYLEAKLKPIKKLNKNGFLIINSDLIPYISDWKLNCKLITFSTNSNNAVVRFDKKNIIYNDLIYKLEQYDYFKYDFNIINFMSLIPILKELNISLTQINLVMREFRQLKYRLETIYKSDDLIIINDSKSTSIMSLYKAYQNIQSIYSNYRLVLICGGKLDKEEIDHNISLLKLIKADKIYLFGENGKYLNNFLKGEIYDKLDMVLADISLCGKKIVLFSPGAQSFDQFNSYIERGIKFEKLILDKLIK